MSICHRCNKGFSHGTIGKGLRICDCCYEDIGDELVKKYVVKNNDG